jgi:hypothetical protein
MYADRDELQPRQRQLPPVRLGLPAVIILRIILGVDQWVIVSLFDKVHIDPTMNGRTREKREKMREKR